MQAAKEKRQKLLKVKTNLKFFLIYIHSQINKTFIINLFIINYKPQNKNESNLCRDDTVMVQYSMENGLPFFETLRE